MDIQYKKVGDYYLPDIGFSEETMNCPPIGKYGNLRWKYLKEHRPILFTTLFMEDKMTVHLCEIDKAAQERLDVLMPQLAKAAGATEELKGRDQMKWVGLMNNCRAQAEEMILAELVYV